MERKIFKTRLGKDTVRYKTQIIDDLSERGTDSATLRQATLLRTMVDTPGFTLSGPNPFQTLRMYHNGSSWIVELEAEVYEPEER